MEIARRLTKEIYPVVPLLAIGSLLVIAGYFLPWVTYHLEGGFLISTVNGWDAVLGNGGIFSFAVGGANLSTPVGWLLFLLLPFPLLMALIALALCFFTPSSPASGTIRSLILWRIFWPVVVLGALEVLLAYRAKAPCLQAWGMKARSPAGDANRTTNSCHAAIYYCRLLA